MKNLKHKRNEKGTTIAEFAIVALLFFTMIFGIIEFGRLLYIHNALTDATRRGARFAAINRGISDADKLAVKNFVVYGPGVTFDGAGNPSRPPMINDLTPEMVQVTFEGVDLDGDPATIGTTGYGTNLGQATVSIQKYQFNLSIPVVGRVLTLPTYTTTTMAESAGEEPADIIVPEPAP